MVLPPLFGSYRLHISSQDELRLAVRPGSAGLLKRAWTATIVTPNRAEFKALLERHSFIRVGEQAG